MCARNLRSLRKDLGSLLIVPKFCVVIESEVVVEPPVVGIVLDPILHQLNGAVGFTGSVRRIGREKTGAELVCGKQLRIKDGGDLQQRRMRVRASGLRISNIPTRATKPSWEDASSSPYSLSRWISVRWPSGVIEY